MTVSAVMILLWKGLFNKDPGKVSIGTTHFCEVSGG